MVQEIHKNRQSKLIAVGFKFQDDVTGHKEYDEYANNTNGNTGIAYKVPWNTCALWNKKFVYGEGVRKLKFDEICENNQLGYLNVKVHNTLMQTEYKGMEDGFAIAELISNNKDEVKYTYKLFDKYLFWRLPKKNERVLKHKIKLARKNIVLSTFVNIKGYSIDKLREAAIKD